MKSPLYTSGSRPYMRSMREKDYIWTHYPRATAIYLVLSVIAAVIVLAVDASQWMYCLIAIVMAGLAIFFPKWIRSV